MTERKEGKMKTNVKNVTERHKNKMTSDHKKNVTDRNKKKMKTLLKNVK